LASLKDEALEVIMELIEKEKLSTLLEKFKEIDPILIVGDVGVDKYTFGDVKRISPEAPVPVLEVTEEWQKLGLAANVVDNFKSLDVPSTICGVVGEDKGGTHFEELLEEKGIKTWGIVRAEGRSTILKERILTKRQQICRIDYESSQVLEGSHEDKLIFRINDLFKGHSCILISDYSKGIFTEKVCKTLIELGNKNGVLVAVDPGRSTNAEWYKGATLLKPNLIEAQAICHSFGYYDKSVEEMAHILMDKLELEKVVITLGGSGIAILDKTVDDEVQILPTVGRDVFDVSGAGDTAISVLCASLLSGASLKDAALMSNLASGVVVGKRGTATVTSSELIEFHEIVSKKA
jgi:D-glycero-beta-D-manno-heptose-7-phosphate kinase